jgi:tRNA A37 N6-isopentenylltransferase MiaA
LGLRRQRVTRERHKAIRQAESERERLKAHLELEHMLARTPDEFDVLARRVNPEDFRMVMLAEIRELRQRLARQAEAMREFGLVDPEEAPPPLPSDRQLPVVSAISFAEVLEALDELETFPEQPPSLAAPAETVATATYFAYLRNAEAGKLRPYASGRKEDPEPLDSDPSFRPG